jgi:hypothetical protein
MSDDGSITYASECAETDSEEDYGGEDEEVVAHQEEPDVCHKVTRCCPLSPTEKAWPNHVLPGLFRGLL